MKFVSWQNLPETLTVDENGNITTVFYANYELVDEAPAGFTATFTDADGKTATFTGGAGAIVTLPEGVTFEKENRITKYKVNGEYITLGEYVLPEGDVTIEVVYECKLGDINGDGVVDISDITAVISRASGNTLDPENYPGNPELTGDTTVDIADITAVIGIASGSSAS